MIPFQHRNMKFIIFSLLFAFGSTADDDLYCLKTPQDLQSKYIHFCRERLGSISKCTTAYNAFTSAFAFKNPASVTMAMYQPYMNVLPITNTPQPNKSLFWSGTFYLVGNVTAKANVLSSANCDASAIINDLGYITWCGKLSGGDGIDYDNRCLCSVTGNFWNQFSINFADAARGIVYFLTWGERVDGAFSEKSVFAMYELPRLIPPNVNKVIALDVHRKGYGEDCRKGTMVDLLNAVANQKLQYSCYNIFGNLQDPTEMNALTTCVSNIITAIQQGQKPEPNACFDQGVGTSDKGENDIAGQ